MSEGLTINFKNYNANYSGTVGEGISIYNQIYAKEELEFSNQITQEEIENIFKLCITGNISIISNTNSSVFPGIEWEAKDGSYVMPKNHILVFECKKNYGTDGDRYTYYCYFKDNVGDNGNVWLIYIIKGKSQEGQTSNGYYPVVFDLQDELEPTITMAKVQVNSEQVDTITAIDTGNFKIGSNNGIALEYSDISLKNTAFNLAYDETIEEKVTITPKYAFTINAQP